MVIFGESNRDGFVALVGGHVEVERVRSKFCALIRCDRIEEGFNGRSMQPRRHNGGTVGNTRVMPNGDLTSR